MGATGFNEMEVDAIGEIMNISLGASATALSTLLGAKGSDYYTNRIHQKKDEFEFKSLNPLLAYRFLIQ